MWRKTTAPEYGALQTLRATGWPSWLLLLILPGCPRRFLALFRRRPGGRFGVGNGERACVAELLLGSLEQGEHFFNLARLIGPAGQIERLVRVVLEIEKLRFVNLRVSDQLPVVVAHGPLHVFVGSEEIIARLEAFAGKQRRQAFAFRTFRHRRPRQLANCRAQII